MKAEVEEKWPELSKHARHWGFYKSIKNVNDKIDDANDSFIGPGQTEEKLTLEPWKWPWIFDGLEQGEYRGKHRIVTIIYSSWYLETPKWWLCWGIPLIIIH